MAYRLVADEHHADFLAQQNCRFFKFILSSFDEAFYHDFLHLAAAPLQSQSLIPPSDSTVEAPIASVDTAHARFISSCVQL
jgi:hypothetical protein